MAFYHINSPTRLYVFIGILSIFEMAFSMERSFVIDYEKDCFLKDGQPFRYISGTMHYFRVPRFYWNDRLQKMRAAGLNAVETYVAWQVHESSQGKYDFTTDNDIFEFIKLAQKNDLLVILRPGPFIDAERDFGGLPSWLLKKKDIILRTSKDPFYLKAVETWFSVLLPKMKDFLYINGGPIIMMQVENEYGSYFACDKVYLEFLRGLFLKHLGDDVILFTVDDGFTDKELECGGLPSLFKTVDFGPTKDVEHGFVKLRKLQPKGPLVNTEYYTGWYDRLGDPHQTRSIELVVGKLDLVLKQNASVNLYMFEGGTSFGFTNGADVTQAGEYVPQPTSYDYDAPLSEAGDPTDKYYAIRKLISKYEKIPEVPVPGPVPKAAYGKVGLNKALSLFDALKYLAPTGSLKSKFPKSMEEIGQAFGFILYRAKIPTQQDQLTIPGKMTIKIEKLRDRSVLLVDKVYQTTFNRSEDVSVDIDFGKELDILVENQGRINYKYGSFKSLHDPKGIIGNVSMNGKPMEDWEIFPLPLDNIADIPWHEIQPNIEDTQKGIPSFYFGKFTVDDANDTFLETKMWNKGQAFVNNFNLGRYWPVMGPQETLYVPKCVLESKPKENTVVLFETDGIGPQTDRPFVEFLDRPVWKTYSKD